MEPSFTTVVLGTDGSSRSTMLPMKPLGCTPPRSPSARRRPGARGAPGALHVTEAHQVVAGGVCLATSARRAEAVLGSYFHLLLQYSVKGQLYGLPARLVRPVCLAAPARSSGLCPAASLLCQRLQDGI